MDSFQTQGTLYGPWDLEMDGRHVAVGFRFDDCEVRTRYWEAAVRLEAPVSQADFGSEKQHRD